MYDVLTIAPVLETGPELGSTVGTYANWFAHVVKPLFENFGYGVCVKLGQASDHGPARESVNEYQVVDTFEHAEVDRDGLKWSGRC